ncbi:DUF3857 domain-containing protein [Hymenobacter sp. CRA2]|uniref:DUF3857 domain-containing protein n=1 Tax=Hymenobacter sp. CRA2 TaxID=1955620 RepID=UPI00098ECC0A|nr:DUF3857 domain-containing protein [Hymenobacter sp. CRA2]OON67361.1 hypothetical protein B0919_17995 [Hymenobacter sp. CRA2]
MQHRLLHWGLALTCAALAYLPAQAQTEPVKFGKIEPKDFDKAAFVGDSAANAVVLCDYGRSYFIMSPKGEFRVAFERVTRIKILKKGGYEWGDGEVTLYRRGGEEEKISNLRGFTYNEGAKGEITKTKLESSSIFTEQLDEHYTRRKFSMPNVHEGSVVEYAYTVSSDFLFNFQDWSFQNSIPTRWSEYRASIPEYFDYKQLWQGYEPMAVQEKNEGTTQFTVSWGGESVGSGFNSQRVSGGSETVTPRVTNYRWAGQNIPALKSEPYMTTTRDYITRVDFELAGVRFPNSAYQNVSNSWEKVQSELLTSDNFGGQLRRGSGLLKTQIAALVAKYPNPAERAAAVHELVRTGMKSSDYGLFSNVGVRKAWEQHGGNAADVNLLLVAALRDAGLQANPVILSTRDHGQVNATFPLISRFNYVVAHVQLPDSQQVLADATEELAPFGMLPEHCLNGQGRLIRDEKNGSWVKLDSPFRHVHFRSAQLTLDERGTLSGKMRDEQSGYLALQQRNDLRQQGEKKYVENLVKELEGWKIDKFAFQNAAVLAKPLMLDLDLRIPGESEQPLGTIYLSLMQALNDAGQNPFKHTERRFPVDFATRREQTSMVTLTLPANYAVEELPKSAQIELPNGGGRFLFNVTPVGNTLQIMSRMTLNRSMFLAEEYPGLREFYERMLAKQAEKIVLKRKS